MSDDIDKYRYELKFICSEAQMAILQARMQNLLPTDPYAQGGSYRIRSLYFDDYENTCFFDNENGTDKKEKYRIRIYGPDSDTIKLERKRKARGKTHKTACAIDRERCLSLIRCDNAILCPEDPPLVKKLILEYYTRLMRPKVIVEYDRKPFIYPDGNVRITLDTDIRSSTAFNGFFEAGIPGRLIMPRGKHILEIKYDAFLPSFIKQLLQLDTLDQTTYSKYYYSRCYSL